MLVLTLWVPSPAPYITPLARAHPAKAALTPEGPAEGEGGQVNGWAADKGLFQFPLPTGLHLLNPSLQGQAMGQPSASSNIARGEAQPEAGMGAAPHFHSSDPRPTTAQQVGVHRSHSKCRCAAPQCGEYCSLMWGVLFSNVGVLVP